MVHVFKEWDKIEKFLKDKSYFVFLDFDGTLSPITKTPHLAFLPEKIKKNILRLKSLPYCKIAIISGRAVDDVKNKVRINGIIYAGNHGLEIRSSKMQFKKHVTDGYLKALGKIRGDLEDSLNGIKGVLIEDKGLSLSLHYRLVRKKEIAKLETVFHEKTIRYVVKGDIKIKPGKKVFEIRPSLDWDKGKVVLWLLARQKFIADKEKLFPIYIGDDVTDEDAFIVLKDKGMSIFVGKPKETRAEYYLRNTSEVADFLSRLSKIER